MIRTELSEAEQLNWLRLTRTTGIGPITFYKLLERFGTATRALDYLPELAKRGGRKTPFVPYPRAEAERELEALKKCGGQLLCAAAPEYPLALAEIDDAPPVLSVLGHLHVLAKQSVGIVGARNASLNGRTLAERIARGLGAQGYVVASGLARGIDTAAHTGSLSTGTIACVAGGVDVVYPSENQTLWDQIRDQGAIISENPLGMEPTAQHFPRRNRLISGLSQGVVIVEASLKSGSLITARCAADQGRDVFAVPGSPLDPRAQGPNSLLKDGAVLVENADDVARHLISFRTSRMAERAHTPYEPDLPDQPLDEMVLTEARTHIRALLSFTPAALDDVIRTSGLPVAIVQTVILELELAGSAQRLSGNRIVLTEKDAPSELERRYR